MSKKSRYPDHIVWDEDNEKFHANILPYASSVSGPKIEIVDIDLFKQRGASKLQKIFKSEFEEIIEKYNNLVDEVALNDMVYNSTYSFEPVVGNLYYLYYGNDGKKFLSLISPNEWDKEHIVSVKLNSELKWVSIKDL
jgi:hypothetical protein|tara:strand:- start:852 stop:1265 length:414 start_codon:yes stop_codon:yes gene_type:complete